MWENVEEGLVNFNNSWQTTYLQVWTYFIKRKSPEMTTFPLKEKWKSLSHVRLFATQWTIQSMEFSRPEYWSGWPSTGDRPNPGIEPRSPWLQADSLPVEPQEKPKNTVVVAYPFSRGSSQSRNWTGVSCIAGGFFTNSAIMEAQISP